MAYIEIEGLEIEYLKVVNVKHQIVNQHNLF